METKSIRSIIHITLDPLPTTHTLNTRSNEEMSPTYRVIDPSRFVRVSASPGSEWRDIPSIYAVTLER